MRPTEILEIGQYLGGLEEQCWSPEDAFEIIKEVAKEIREFRDLKKKELPVISENYTDGSADALKITIKYIVRGNPIEVFQLLVGSEENQALGIVSHNNLTKSRLEEMVLAQINDKMRSNDS